MNKLAFVIGAVAFSIIGFEYDSDFAFCGSFMLIMGALGAFG